MAMEKICLPIPAQIAFTEVSFILQTGLSSGKIYLDDISLGNTQCPRKPHLYRQSVVSTKNFDGII
ncbi:hypothetical protein DPMN_170531 [Dreissena polymorpha]|uniref:Uncharacterized protein n=1 Tax=Dreissena polymorpha TaxID=45954 RepID=A0A9D4IBM0_DREPO|nr:hypothetical protein DPMN_170531 [Dreissena polymorpha]